MPKLFTIGGYIVFFWSGENAEPVHVHVARGKASPDSTKFWLTADGGCLLASNGSAISERDLRTISRVIVMNHALICNRWSEFFGAVEFYR